MGRCQQSLQIVDTRRGQTHESGDADGGGGLQKIGRKEKNGVGKEGPSLSSLSISSTSRDGLLSSCQRTPTSHFWDAGSLLKGSSRSSPSARIYSFCIYRRRPTKRQRLSCDTVESSTRPLRHLVRLSLSLSLRLYIIVLGDDDDDGLLTWIPLLYQRANLPALSLLLPPSTRISLLPALPSFPLACLPPRRDPSAALPTPPPSNYPRLAPGAGGQGDCARCGSLNRPARSGSRRR